MMDHELIELIEANQFSAAMLEWSEIYTNVAFWQKQMADYPDVPFYQEFIDEIECGFRRGEEFV